MSYLRDLILRYDLITSAFWTALWTVIWTLFLTWFLGKFFKSIIKILYYTPKMPKCGKKKNTILVIGLGRTGKSLLIENITKPLKSTVPYLTNKFEVKKCEYPKEDKNSKISKIKFFFTDYRGQDFSQLIRSFIQEQLEPNSKLRYGSINSLILVVDLFRFKGMVHFEKEEDYDDFKQQYPEAFNIIKNYIIKKDNSFQCDYDLISENDLEKLDNIMPDDKNSKITALEKIFEKIKDKEPNRKFNELDITRINENLHEWNRTALDAVFGLLTRNELKYICLFINKKDKWVKDGHDGSEIEIMNQYKDLIEELKKRADPYAIFEPIIGSAFRGDYLSTKLVKQLGKYSVPEE